MRTRRGSTPGKAGDDDLGPVLEFLRVLWAVNHSLESMSKQMKRRFGVTGRDRIVIRLIGSRPGTSAGELAEVLHVDPSTLTGVLGRLVKRGLVSRTAHPEDARRAVLILTRGGREIDQMRTGTIEARVREALAQVSQADARAAAKVLSKLAALLSS
jgi:DNA-binding MarR family transcriptional regulator